jgi:hypothetical protein
MVAHTYEREQLRIRAMIPLFVAAVTLAAFMAAVARAGRQTLRVHGSAFRSVAASFSPLAAHRLFTASSVWNEPLRPNASLDPSSPARVAWLLKYLRQPGHGPWINTYQYSVPVYRVSARQPTVRVRLDAWAPMLERAWLAVPVPRGARPAAGTDASLVVYQPSTDKMWEFWQLRHEGDGWHARWGGAMADVSTNPGYYSSGVWPGLAVDDGWGWGSSASSLPAVAGLMTISELREGRIDHALAVATPEACAGWFAWPAQRTDGGSTDRNCLPEGAHLRLDPRLDLTALHLPPIALMMARAMQDYGIIVHDTTHSSFSFFAEQPTSGPDPYVGPDGTFDGLQEWQFLPLIPWNRLQLLPIERCSRSPCVASAARRQPKVAPS